MRRLAMTRDLDRKPYTANCFANGFQFWMSVPFIVALLLLLPLVSSAQSQSSPTYDALDIWLRAEQLNQRCQILNYFEVREIERGINFNKNLTPEGVATQAAIGWPSFETELTNMVAMLDARRNTARLAVAKKVCSDLDTDIRAVRSNYVRSYLKGLIAAQQSQARLTGRNGRRNAGDLLLRFAQTLYGANYETVGQAVVQELQAEGFDADTAWNALKNPIDDGLWQMRLSEKGYNFQSLKGQPGYYQAIKRDGTGTVFPARFSHRFNPKIVDGGGYEIEINQAEGVTDDGRFVILVSKDAADWGPKTLRAQLLVQETSAQYGWIGISWREFTLRFDAEVETGTECPADFCFTFPPEATEAVRSRRAQKDGFFNYELVIAPPNAFPLEDKMSEYGRVSYYPPSLVAD